MKSVANAGMAAVAMTDFNNLFAMVKFYKAAMAEGLKPIFGIDILVAEAGLEHPYHLILLCQNNTGYRNVTRLISRAYLHGQVQGIPRVQAEWLEAFSEGVIALSGGRDGDVGQLIIAGHADAAAQRVQHWCRVFPGRYYLELQRTGRLGEEDYLHTAVAIAAEQQVPVVASNDVRFIAESDFEAHEARVCIRDGYALIDPKRPKRYSAQQYLRTPEEMGELFADIPSALSNTVEIAKRCNVSLTLGKNYLPQFPIPDGMTEAEYFCKVSEEGLEARLDFLFAEQYPRGTPEFAAKRQPYDERLKVELSVINNMGFPGYFLIVADFIQWAKDNGIPVGPGRGSGAGSLVAYALKITDIDPLQYDLLFERFLNPERVSMPDFDIDFCMDNRDKVIDYVARQYGRNQVSQIITYGSMAAKAVVRDVGRVLGHPYGFVDRIAKQIPFEVGMTLTKALAESEDLKNAYDNDEEVRYLLDLALSLEGLSRNVGKHAGGVLISPSDLTDFTPIYCEEGGGSLVSQFDKDDVEAVGLVKFDFLGLRNLTIIDWALHRINEVRRAKGEADLDINRIDLNDKASFDLLKAQKTTAVFQLESRGMKELIKRLQPDIFEDIIALVALYRPGPLQSGMVDDFINRKHGRAKVEYPHPDLEPILSPTYGVILYQEQVMQIAQVLAGYTLGEADMLRRAMGKKKPEEMAKQRELFMSGAKVNHVNVDVAGYIFDLMEKFAGYGFNKSHSAAYALVSFQTAWLKAHHPAAFMAAVLSADMDNTDKVVMLLDDCRQLGLTILPPDINRSQYAFSVDLDENIIYGLGAVKGAGEAAINHIMANRGEEGAFSSLLDVCQRVYSLRITRRVLETLIKAGVMDSLPGSRRAKLAYLPEALRMAEQYHRDKGMGQVDLFGGAIAATASTQQAMPELPEWPERERLRLEKDTLGLYLTGHPLDEYANELKAVTSKRLLDIVEYNGGSASGQGYQQREPVLFAALVGGVRSQSTDRGKRYFVKLEDRSVAEYEILLFNDVFEQFGHLLEKEAIVVLEGTIAMDQRTGNPRLRIDNIYNMQAVREQFLRRLKVVVHAEQANQTLLEAFETLFVRDEASPAHYPVVVDYCSEMAQAELRLDQQLRMPLDDGHLEQLRQLLGNESVCLEF